ncbi:MAG: hypothetical protein KDA41_22480, partial [Planctomycetales bacterium]|nr:hypothetical protein [Planctomycetales bacterium]
MKLHTLAVALLLVCGGAWTLAQETVRQLDGAGRFDKHLTPGLLDRWVFKGEKGETVLVHVASGQFDPVLELATPGEKEDKLLLTVDDEGSESRFAIRLPETGEYKIRVHAFEYKGGGNYSLQVRRFQATGAAIGKTVVGTFDRNGRGHHWFDAKKDQIVAVGLAGAQSGQWELLDVKGRRADVWANAAAMDDDGAYSLIVSGAPGARYELSIREAQQRELPADKPLDGRL